MGQTSGAGTGEPRVDEIFADARSMQTQAIERLEARRHPRRGREGLVRRQASHRRPGLGPNQSRTSEHARYD